MTTTANEQGVRVTRVVPDAADTWRRLAHELDNTHLAHSPEWATVIQQAYGHDPVYLVAEDEAGCTGLLPAFSVRRPLGGTVVTSMPFLDGGGPCSSSVPVADALVARLIGEAHRLGAGAVELRCATRLNLATPPMEHKVNLTLSLPADPDCLWRRLDGSVRNQIRKAEKSGLSVEFGGAENLPPFYEMFAMRMHDLGSPVHAPEFLAGVLASFGERARIALIRKDRTPVGGLVALAFKDIVTVPWASCLKEYFTLCPNMLLYWETIRAACREGFRRFDFGRSSRGSGTYRFKRQWGALDTPLYWYTIPIARHRIATSPAEGRMAPRLVGVWQRLPLSVTRRLGPHVRKYLIQ